MLPELFGLMGGLVIGQTHFLQDVATGSYRAVEGFAHNLVGPNRIKLISVHPVMCARHNEKIGSLSSGMTHELGRGLRIIEGNYQNSGGFQTCRVQQFRSCRITVKPFEPEAAHQFDRAQIMIQNRCLEARYLHQPVYHLSKPSDPGDDDRLWVIYRVRVALLGAFVMATGKALIGNKQKRGEQHRKCNHQQQCLA